MFRRLMMAGATFLAMTATAAADSNVPAGRVSAVLSGGLLGVGASIGRAAVEVPRGGALDLAVESWDVSRIRASRGRLASPRRMVARAPALEARAVAEPRTSRQPLVTLFDRVEKPAPRTTDEHLTVGLDYRVSESGELPFEVAKSGSLNQRHDSHSVMLTAQFSF